MPNPLDPALPLTAGASDEFTYNWLVELKTAAIIHGEAAEVEDDSVVPALILIVLDESQNISAVLNVTSPDDTSEVLPMTIIVTG